MFGLDNYRIGNNELSGIPGIPGELNDDYTKLLLHMNGANNSTAFIDSSPTPKTVTVNGDAKISTTQSKFGGSSGYFSGSYTNLRLPNSNDYNFGAGDFTIDFWMNSSNVSSAEKIIYDYLMSAAATSCLRINTNYPTAGCITAYLYSGGSYVSMTSSVAITTGTWYHVALVRNNNVVTLYLNGTSVATREYTLTLNNTCTNYLYIGSDYTGGDRNFIGYLQEFRISKGIARWTSNFTPPAFADTDVAAPLILISQSMLKPANFKNYYDDYTKFFVDSSVGVGIGDAATNKIIYDASAVLNSSVTHFTNKYSMYFSGHYTHLILPNSNDYNFGAGDFTVDFWMNSSNVSGTEKRIYDYTDGTAEASSLIITINNPTAGSGCISAFLYSGRSSVVSMTSSVAITTGTWYHVALVRNNNVVTLYLNGTSVATRDYTLTLNSCGSYLYIGCNYTNSLTGRFIGYLQEFRISKGIARWTSNFTPPAFAYADTDVAAPYPTKIASLISKIDDYTKLLLHMNGANNSTAFTDSSLTPKTVTPNGNAKISTTQSKFGGRSGYFDGTNSYLSIPASSDFLLDGNFTIDFWVYFNSLSSTDEQVIFCQTSFSASFFTLRVASSYICIVEASSQQTIYSLTTLTWHHIAVVRNNGNIKLFVDGVQINTDWAKTTAYFNGSGIDVGKYYTNNNTMYLNGYLQEFRISKGVARWTGNFTPPTAQYDDYKTSTATISNGYILLP